MASGLSISSVRSLAVATLLLCLCAGTVFAQQGRFLERVRINPGTNQSQIRIDLNTPVQYVTHAPMPRGDLLQIKLQLTDPALQRGGFFEVDEVLPATPTRHVPLTEVQLSSQSGVTGLILRFNYPVEYDVQSSADFRSVIVTVLHGSETAAAPAEDAVVRPLVINLVSSAEPIDRTSIEELPQFSGLKLYTYELDEDTEARFRLRLGFFQTRSRAESLLAQLLARFPQATIVEARSGEPRASASAAAKVEFGPAAQADVSAGDVVARKLTAPVDTSTGDKIAKLMEEARQMMATENYSRAVQLYTKVLETPQHPMARDALEFLGLARERKRQFAHAKRIYDDYLERYPDSEGAARVEQRILAMITATQQPKPSLRVKEEGPSKLVIATGPERPGEAGGIAIEYDVFGGFSQFYRYNGIAIQKRGSDPTQSAVANDLDVTGRVRTGGLQLASRFSGGYTGDMLEDGPDDERRVSALFVELEDRAATRSARVGRQSHNKDGVLGRFDGALVEYQANDWLGLRGSTGSPVNSSRDVKPEFDRYFFSFGADFRPFSDAWDFNLFFIEQRADGYLDRRAIGGEVRYFAPGRSLFSIIDYDVDYGSLNTFSFLGSLQLESKTSLNLSLNYRNSPILTTSNAIQGQRVDTLDQLLNRISEDEARDLAEDRTAVSKTGTLTVTHPLNDHYQVTADVTATSLSSTPSSGGVIGLDGTGIDFFYSGQLIGSSLLRDADTFIFGFRYSDLNTSETATVNLNYRFPVNPRLRLNPRVRIDHRRNKDATEQLALRPSFRANYRLNRSVQLEVEAGADWLWREINGADRQRTILMFGFLGYRWQF